MKRFENPKMTIIHLSGEDIIHASVVCEDNTCYGFICDDCGSCTGGYECGIFDCGTRYRGLSNL